MIDKATMESFRTLADTLFSIYYRKHTCVSNTISVFTVIFTFKFNKMYYSHFYSFDMFKARWTKGKFYRKLMTNFGFGQLVIDAMIFGIAVYSLV